MYVLWCDLKLRGDILTPDMPKPFCYCLICRPPIWRGADFNIIRHRQANFGTFCVGNSYSLFTPNVICVLGDHVKTNHCLVSIGDVEVRLVVVFMKVFDGVRECIALDDSLQGDADIHVLFPTTGLTWSKIMKVLYIWQIRNFDVEDN